MNSGATGFPASDLISKPPHPTPSHVFTPFSPLPDLESILDRPSHRPATLITDHATRRPVFIAIDPSFLLYFLLILPAPAPDTFSPHSASSIVSRYNPSPSSSPFKFILLPSNLSRRRDLTYAFNERASPDISPFHLEILVCSNTSDENLCLSRRRKNHPLPPSTVSKRMVFRARDMGMDRVTIIIIIWGQGGMGS